MPEVSARYAWQTAERRCFNYLLSVLGALEGVQGFLSKYPRTVASPEGDLNQWRWEIVGGGSDIHVPNPPQRGAITSWHDNAMFEGRYTDRALAQQTVGILRDSLPAGRDVPAGAEPETAIEGVSKIYISQHPAILPDTAELVSDLDSKGGLVEVWRVVVPMMVAYDNAEQIT